MAKKPNNIKSDGVPGQAGPKTASGSSANRSETGPCGSGAGGSGEESGFIPVSRFREVAGSQLPEIGRLINAKTEAASSGFAGCGPAL